LEQEGDQVCSASYRLQIGRFSCLIIKDGTEDAPLLSRYMSPVPNGLEGHRIYMLGGLMLVETEGSRILLDAGNGPRSQNRTHFASRTFEKEGIVSESIDTVLITHGDPDHIGGLLTRDGELAYPHARYVLHRDLWDAWHAKPSQGLYFAHQASFVTRLASLLANCVETFHSETDVGPGIRSIPALGHRCGHTAYLFVSEGAMLLHIGDAAFDPIFLEYTDFPNVRDTEPEPARIARQMLVERAITEDALVVGSHFCLPGVGRLARNSAGRYEWRLGSY
jgi:glyoxylase-like metal-dependent hydrolase (beta-lactamase superfamily II)